MSAATLTVEILLNSSNFPELVTHRFLLRQMVTTDVPAIFQNLSDPRVVAFYGITYETLEATQEQIDWFRELEREQTGLWWGICPAEAPQQLIGACGVYELDRDNDNAELGYWLSPQHWHQGVMRECLTVILRHAFEVMHLHRIEAEVEPANVASCTLLPKLGFIYEGQRREVARRAHGYLDMNYYALLASEFQLLADTKNS